MTNTDTVIDHIAGFTQHRDKELLDISLFKSIESMVPDCKVELISITSRYQLLSKTTLQGLSICKPQQANANEQELFRYLEQMITNSETELSASLQSSFVFVKLFEDETPNYQFLIVYLEKPMELTLECILRGMFAIYTNFYKLLNESQTDELTGLANRKTFEMQINKIFDKLDETTTNHANERRFADSNEPKKFWLAAIDIDNFKMVNDTFGHLYGDEILVKLGQLIKDSFRVSDRCFRFGGEEFVVILQANSKDQSFAVIDRFRKKVAEHKFPQEIRITVSIGIAEIEKNVFQMTLVDFADQALYESKRTGKNKITFFEDLVTAGKAQIADVTVGEIKFF